MKLIVTGGRGFLGRWVVKRALEAGHEVVVGCRTAQQASELQAAYRSFSFSSSARFAACDVCDEDQVAHLVEQEACEVIVHCAAYGVDFRQQDAVTATRVNTLGAVCLREATARVGSAARIVFVGTAYEYGLSKEPLTERHPLSPIGLYGASKAAASLLISQMPLSPAWCICRPFGMFGPGEGSHKLVPQIVEAARERRVLALTDGADIRDYSYVGDIAKQLVALAQLPERRFPAGRTFNLCSGQATTIRDFATRVAAYLGAEDLLRFGVLPSRSREPGAVVGDPSSFREFVKAEGMPDSLLASESFETVMAGFAVQEEWI